MALSVADTPILPPALSIFLSALERHLLMLSTLAEPKSLVAFSQFTMLLKAPWSLFITQQRKRFFSLSFKMLLTTCQSYAMFG
jgi:hypothetical protein